MVSAELQQVKQRFHIVGTDEKLLRAIDVAIQVAQTDLSVLVQGESGAGKESFPQIIHTNSSRKHGTYIAVNCGAIPEGTIDSELFGHEKGSFTGAISDRKGYFEVANGGTIFLDEIGEMPMTTQARLLRVLEAGEFIRVGSSEVKKTDVRVIAATNVNLPKAISEGKFREDLYYRLNTVPIYVPPLRERRQDIALLFRKFASDFAEKYRMPAVRLSQEAQDMLTRYSWPGNIRQLKNITEQISILEQDRDISAEKLSLYLPYQEEKSLMPVAATAGGGDSTTTNASGARMMDDERQFLYQILSDMRRDMNDLKKVVHDIIGKQPDSVSQEDIDTFRRFEQHQSAQFSMSDTNEVSQQDVIHQQPVVISNNGSASRVQVSSDIQDTEEYIEDVSHSLCDMEREAIRKALERHRNKRKLAAQDLKISERTLYRKIKEYGLE